MGRSVSTPPNATVVAYAMAYVADLELGEDQYEENENPVPDIQDVCKTFWPSLRTCDEWLDREDHAILENAVAYVGVSEYCGLVAVWILPKCDANGHNNLGEQWAINIAPSFLHQFSTLKRLGTMSNGQSVYERTTP